MAVDAYIQTAASHLENAAVALKQEAEQIRAGFMTEERQINHEISTKEAERRVLAANSASAPDAEAAAHLLAEAHRHKTEIDQLKKDLEKKRSEMNQAVKDKEGKISDLMSQARGLYSKASNMK